MMGSASSPAMADTARLTLSAFQLRGPVMEKHHMRATSAEQGGSMCFGDGKRERPRSSMMCGLLKRSLLDALAHSDVWQLRYGSSTRASRRIICRWVQSLISCSLRRKGGCASCSASMWLLSHLSQHWKQRCCCRRNQEAKLRTLRATSIEAPGTDVGEVERLARRLEAVSQRMADLLRRAVLEPSLAYALLMKKGGQQAPAAKTKAKSQRRGRTPTNGAGALDVSPPRPPPERPPTVFVRRHKADTHNSRNVVIGLEGHFCMARAQGRPGQFQGFSRCRKFQHGPQCKDDA